MPAETTLAGEALDAILSGRVSGPAAPRFLAEILATINTRLVRVEAAIAALGPPPPAPSRPESPGLFGSAPLGVGDLVDVDLSPESPSSSQWVHGGRFYVARLRSGRHAVWSPDGEYLVEVGVDLGEGIRRHVEGTE